jgi:GntR family transcriptional regulator, transcriptional repressor for pyruvate dehydrogenase complex
MKFEPLHKTRIFESIVKQILEQIRDGDLSPGDRLPSERELSDMFQVSRNSVREALRTLEMMNYVEIRSGEGVFIKEISLDELMGPLVSSISSDKSMILDLLDVRDVIEVEMARRAAIYSTDHDIKNLQECLDRSIESVKNGGLGLKEDSDFHSIIAQSTQNSAFVMLMNLIKDSLTLSREATLKIPGQPERTIADHTKVYEAIVNRNPEDASSCNERSYFEG